MTDSALTPVPAYDPWDRIEARSLINLLGPEIQSSFLAAAQKRPELFGLDERGLFKMLRAENAEPSQTDNHLRFKFWFEYEAAQTEHRDMEMVRVYSGVCHKSYFYGRFLSCITKVAWLVTPPLDYEKRQEEALEYASHKMRDILELDPEKFAPQSKSAQLKLMEMQAKIFNLLEMRKKGAFTQRIDQRNMNLNVSTTEKGVAEALIGHTEEALTKRIKALELAERKAANLGDPVTIEVKAETKDE